MRAHMITVMFTLVIACAVFFTLKKGLTLNPQSHPSPLVGKPLPALDVAVLDHGDALKGTHPSGAPVRITLDTLRQGYSGIVLNFWASWCQSCGEEAKVLESAWEGARVQNILFVGIAVQDTPDHAKLHALELGKTYPIAWDDQNKVSVDFGVSGVPETFFVNKDGVIVAKHIGPLSADELKQYLHTLLTQAELYSSPVQE